MTKFFKVLIQLSLVLHAKRNVFFALAKLINRKYLSSLKKSIDINRFRFRWYILRQLEKGGKISRTFFLREFEMLEGVELLSNWNWFCYIIGIVRVVFVLENRGEIGDRGSVYVGIARGVVGVSLSWSLFVESRRLLSFFEEDYFDFTTLYFRFGGH